ncbi:hypothetical protein LJC07_00100 [Christensenellaceae bacterium OttesenSCG-928-L17]|nr:hypothetical protein [Christensenellaceae bacterium OttesenSCG-928-L17]
MEQAAKQKPYVNTRVYSPTHGTSAYAYEPATAPNYAPAPGREPEREPRRQPLPQPQKKRKLQPALSRASKAALLLSIVLISCALLFAVMGYYNISKQYIAVNELQQSIDVAERNIRALNIELECAVSINDIQEAAQRLGMTYPAASQYVRAGDAIPSTAIQDNG